MKNDYVLETFFINYNYSLFNIFITFKKNFINIYFVEKYPKNWNG